MDELSQIEIIYEDIIEEISFENKMRNKSKNNSFLKNNNNKLEVF